MEEETRIRICITNQMPDFRSCAHRDAHTPNCDGREYAWNEAHHREESTGRDCKGCRPREARYGYMCLACFDKVQTAIADWGPFERLIDGIDRAVQRDNNGVRGQSIGYVPIPGTVLAVEEIRSYFKSFPGTIELWVGTVAGAKDARRFARAVEGAQRTHAVEEKAHKVKRTRCTNCGQLALAWNPPVSEGSDVTVACTNCGHKMDQDSFDKIAAIEKPLVPSGIRATGGRDEFAETYDPARVEHADLDPLTLLSTAQLRERLPEDTPKLRYLRRAELIEAIHETLELIQ